MSGRRHRLDTRALNAATSHLDPPLAVVDLGSFDANRTDLARRAAGTPIRVASKSVRCRALIDRALQHPGFRGVMAYSVAEAVWLTDNGVEDVVVAYPSADRSALRDVARSEARCGAITLMVDSTAHLDLIDATTGSRRPDLRVCIDVDASLRLLAAHLGVRRSPVRTPEQAASLAGEITKRPGFSLVGVMFYEAQIAGLPDTSPLVRMVKSRSASDLSNRRAAVLAAVRDIAPVEIVNGGGTGSIEVTVASGVVTEVTAGSGLFGPALFDGYRAFSPQPAAAFALPVVRRPSRRIATLFGGGYIASGPPGASRLPRPSDGLSLLRAEGAGEVQTPVRGRHAEGLAVGDRVWMRHAKAGEMCERFDNLHLLRDRTIESVVPTYRGEGKNFG